MMNNILWLYWENLPGKVEPPHITLCRKIIKRKCPNVDIHLVTDSNLNYYLPDLHENINKITMNGKPCLATKTDFIRVFLLEKFGGLYLDSDTIVMTNLDFIIDMLWGYDFIGYRRKSVPTKHIANNFMAAKAQSPIIKEYAYYMRSRLEYGTEYGWGEVGAHGITPIIDKRDEEDCFLFLEREIHPIPAEKQYLFMDKELEVKGTVPASTVCVMLFHDLFAGGSKAYPPMGLEYCKEGWLNGWDETDLLSSDILLSKIFRKAVQG